MAITFIALNTINVSSAVASITFSSIPSTYTDLCLLLSLRMSDANGGQAAGTRMRINGDTGANYFYKVLEAFSGTGRQSYSSNSDTSVQIGGLPTNSNTASVYGNNIVYIPNYTSSSQKTISGDSVTEYDSATLGVLNIQTGRWTGTSAITSLNIYATSGNIMANSTATLYGIKNTI